MVKQIEKEEKLEEVKDKALGDGQGRDEAAAASLTEKTTDPAKVRVEDVMLTTVQTLFS